MNSYIIFITFYTIVIFILISIKFMKCSYIRKYIVNSQIYQNITGKYDNIYKYENIYSCVKSYENEIITCNSNNIPLSIRSNKRFIIEAIKINRYFFFTIFPKNIIDLEILNIFIENSKSFYIFDIPEKFRNDKKIILKSDNIAENYDLIPEELQEDDDILNKALKENFSTFNYKNEGNFFNLEIINKDDIKNGRYYGYFLLPLQFQDNLYILKKALELNGNILKFLIHHKNNKELVKIAINENPKYCEFLHPLFTIDEEIALIALKKDVSVIKYFHSRIKEDYEFLSKVLETNKDLIKYNNIPYKGFEWFWDEMIIENDSKIKYLDKKYYSDLSNYNKYKLDEILIKIN